MSGPVPDLPTEEDVLKAVDKAGWLLEQQAARILESSDFNTQPSWAFSDPDQPSTSRELDVFSYRNFWWDSESKVGIGASVLVECKQSSNPYCAIGQDPPEWRRKGNPTEHTVPARFTPEYFDFEKARLQYGYTWDVMGFRALALQHGQTNFRATQLTRIEHKNASNPTSEWVANNAGIFDQLTYPLAKAVRASQRKEQRRTDWGLHNGHPPKERKDWADYTIRFPVVLISSPLYVVDAGSDDPQFSEAKWVRVQRHLESTTLKGRFEFDVVTRDAFVEYIQNVEKFMTAFTNLVKSAPLRYTGELWIPPGMPTGKPLGYSVPSEQYA